LIAGANDAGTEPDSVLNTTDLTDVAAARAARLCAAAAAAAKICTAQQFRVILIYNSNKQIHICKDSL